MTKFLQSESWKVFQEARGRTTHQLSGDGWHLLAVHEPTRFGVRITTPGGPIADTPESLEVALAALTDYARSCGAYCIRVEPECLGDIEYASFLRARGYKPAHKNINPERTIVNDVTASPDDITAAISTRHRYLWRRNIREGVTFTASFDPSDIAIFLDMIHDVAQRTGMHPHPDSYFQTIAKTLFPIGAAGLLIATLDRTPVASVLYYADDDTMLYAHAGAYSKLRALSPGTALAVQTLLYAHEQGYKQLDFYGIAPENAPKDHPWYGFTMFKRGFNGTPVDRSGTWELPLKRATYAAARLSVSAYDLAKKHKKY